jgi:hypothetical protein
MPIRSSRGRAAAYRGVWQWPLRSPARLAVTAAVVLALAVGISTAIGGASSRGAAPVDPGRTAAPPPGASAAADPSSATATSLPLDQAPQPALVAATRWATAWVRPPEGTSAQEWLDGLEPTTTEEYLGLLATVDPTNNPATRVTGAARAVRVAPRAVDVEVPTDALVLVVTVVDTETGWRVVDHERA